MCYLGEQMLRDGAPFSSSDGHPLLVSQLSGVQYVGMPMIAPLRVRVHRVEIRGHLNLSIDVDAHHIRACFQGPDPIQCVEMTTNFAAVSPADKYIQVRVFSHLAWSCRGVVLMFMGKYNRG